MTGRLAQFFDTWKVLTRDTWVLNTIKGYAIPLKGKPFQNQRPLQGVFLKDQTALLKEIKSLLREGCHLPLQGGQQFLLNHLSSSQKEWSDEASDQSETSE